MRSRYGEREARVLEIGGARVPALFSAPNADAPVPAALLLHGWSSRKERMADTIGDALLDVGIASVSIDLPLHGERAGAIPRDPFTALRLWSAALAECAAAMRWLGAHPKVDADRLAIAGYSLGSFLALEHAARDGDVRAVVVASGGDLPERTPMLPVVRRVIDPLRTVKKLAGRPLLMLHGTDDRTVLPTQAQRLFEAAVDPKEIRWWPSGHRLPDPAIDAGAAWLSAKLR